jgi:regulator of protease activity HflC (stomatin/prohibitin superfamily)
MYVLRYKNGKVVQEGAGLSFFYYAPSTSLVAIPMGSNDTPFIFEEVTLDYQAVTIQGQVAYRIAKPLVIAGILNFTLDNSGRNHASDDPQKLSQRIVNLVQVLTRKHIQKATLRESLRSNDSIAEKVSEGLKAEAGIASLGIEILSCSILAIRPNKETSRALEAEAREQILKEADDAIYLRRNASVEQERIIKENELSTEIAVENKKRQIREAQMDAEKSVQDRKHDLKAAEMAFSIRQEDEKKKLVEIAVLNSKAEAEANAFAISAVMKAFHGVEPMVIQSLATMGMQPNQLIAMAFQGLAEKAEKIGQLNITPELLGELMKKNG